MKVCYAGQAREAAGCAAEELTATSAAALLAAAAERHEALRPLLLRGDGRPHPSVLVIVDGEQRRGDDPRPLPDGAVVTLLTPLSGG